MRTKRYLFAAIAAVPSFMTAEASASDATDAFKDQTVTYIVATAAGGGYDLYGRLVAEFMGRHLPGSTFVVRNVPGAGHIIGANTIYASKPDGLTIGTFNTGLIYGQIVGLQGIQFDLAKMSWIGKAASDQRVIIIADSSPIKTFTDLKNTPQEVLFSTSGVGAAAYVETRVLVDLFNLPIKLVTGYSGTDDQMAMRRGEITGTIASRSSNAQFVKNGYGRFIAQIGGSDRDVPQLSKFAETSEAKALIALFRSQAEISRLTAGPPKIPADRLNALRSAYKAALGDPELLAKAKQAGRPIDPAFGEDVEKTVREALNQPPQTVAKLKEAMAAKPELVTTRGEVVEVLDKGRTVIVQSSNKSRVKFEPSGSRTKITIAGKDAKRNELKAGQACEVTHAEGSNEPAEIICKALK